ncbi:MAG: hypothetical protein OEN23_06385, partial [Paracoccaceae bacterium]|nr:hypothetical protein [Paracoccaceae bacterium]
MIQHNRIFGALALVLVSGFLAAGQVSARTVADPGPAWHPAQAGEQLAQRLTPQTAAPNRGFRRNDGPIRRQLRRSKGVPLGDRVRLGIQERIREDRQHRFEDRRPRDGVGKIRIDDRFGGRTLDDAGARRLDRSSQAEREAQARARTTGP